jgi:hypothetical protein
LTREQLKELKALAAFPDSAIDIAGQSIYAPP